MEVFMKRIISICLSICLVFNTLSLIGNNVVYAKEKNQIKQQFKSYAGEKKLYIKKLIMESGINVAQTQKQKFR